MVSITSGTEVVYSERALSGNSSPPASGIAPHPIGLLPRGSPFSRQAPLASQCHMYALHVYSRIPDALKFHTALWTTKCTSTCIQNSALISILQKSNKKKTILSTILSDIAIFFVGKFVKYKYFNTSIKLHLFQGYSQLRILFRACLRNLE